MTNFKIKYLFLILCIVQSKSDIYKDRPKIKTSDGDLIFEPAYDKSVYINPNGPKSNIFVGNINILDINITRNAHAWVPTDKYNEGGNLEDINKITRRIEHLENVSTILPNSAFLNFTYLTRRLNTLNNRVRTLQTLVNTRRKDDCLSYPCENGGTCLNLGSGYYCLCPTNWKGVNCDEDVNECRIYAGTDLGCQNDATCVNRPGSYECICKPGWFGVHCTRKERNCTGNDFEICGHGTCLQIASGIGIKCLCEQGWTTNETSVACLTDVNECLSSQGPRCSVNPPVDCINIPGSFVCGHCPSGYEGDGFICRDIDECLTLPNGGCSLIPKVSCHNIIGSRICGSCPSGYTGDGVTCTWRGSCHINGGGCHPSAHCVETPGYGERVVQCICPQGMSGNGVGVNGCYVAAENANSTGCENFPCGLHGRCHQLRYGYSCICSSGYSGVHCDKPADFCFNNPCLNGGTCRVDGRSARGYRCECSALYTGDLCQLHAEICGGLLDAEEGSIIYPLTNNTRYKANARCAWVIHTEPNKVINVTFSKFNLEYHADCYYDFVQIHDGRSSASQLIGRFCGRDFPNGGNIISTHNNLYFWFRSDQSIAGEGFALHWNSISPICGGLVNATTHGRISSPGSPANYPPNRDCYWRLVTNLGKRIQLHFFQLDIDSHANCSFDYLAIYDGLRQSDPLLNKFCNSSQPAPIQSAGSEVLIHFHSDAKGRGKGGKGFQITYAPAEGFPGCGGFYTSDKGEIMSPRYNNKYLSNLLCDYKIQTKPESKIRLTFKSFNLERSFNCRYDHLKIYDGPGEDSRLVGKFCGNNFPKPYTSSSNTLFLQFKSDQSISSKGFEIVYESICHKTIMGDSGIIKSPGYPISYPINTNCEFIIGTSPGKAIELTFRDFDLEYSKGYYNCQYDYVEIRDGPTPNSTLLGKYCGGSDHIPPTQTSSFNYLYLKFHSDISISGTGFYANFTTINTECGGIYRETTGLINHPSSGNQQYRNDQSCTWILIAPEGMLIKLIWNRFNTERQLTCNNDYVELIEVDANNENSTLGKYCGTTLPPALTTSSNRLLIKFQSDASLLGTGFSLSYTFLDEKTHCGGIYAKTHGYIYSPGWPGDYEPNRDCTWTISVPVGQQVILNISDFDLERPIRDKCILGDYLEIRDGSSQNAALITKLCGRFKSKRIVSTAHSLYIHFHSDFYISGSGFKIEWDGTIRGCGGTLTGASGSISSPNYPQDYNDDAECFYKIVTSSGSRIRINFVDLDLESTPNCRDDYVEIYNGPNIYAPSLGRYCTFNNNTSIETTGNYAFIKFRSDIFIGGKGFLFGYETICHSNLSGSYGVIESPGYPSNYRLNLDCLWTISVGLGNRINITFTDFDVPSSVYRYHPGWFHRPYQFRTGFYRRYTYTLECGSNFLQLVDISEENVSKSYCGQSLPSAMTTKSNSLQVKFVSGLHNSGKGFRLEWVRDGCGARMKKRFGSIIPPKHLINSHNKLECEWVIETPPGTRVSVDIDNIFLEETKNCTTDVIEIYNGQSSSSNLITKICHRGLNVFQASSNFMFIKFIKKSSLGDAYFSLNFDSKTNGCGGTMVARSGLIYSNNYPKNYDNNMDCLWYIKVPNNHRIELNILDLDLYWDEDEEDYCSDSIKIYEGTELLGSNYSYLICPKSNISQIITNSANMIVQFDTDNYGTAKGFKANFSASCGAVIEASNDGIISSDSYIRRSLLNCTWVISSPDLVKKIKLTIEHMSVPRDLDVVSNKECPSSFLKIYDGNDVKSPVIGEYCGYKVPPMIVSHGSALTVTHGTYGSLLTGYFTAHYSIVSNECGGTLSSEEGSIASPNYPLSYPPGIDCEWTLKASAGNSMYITFEALNMPDSDNCNEDYLEIREDHGAGRMLGLYCGDTVPTNTSTGSIIFVKFHSNTENTGLGFLAHFGLLHDNVISGQSYGEIASPLYPNSYERVGEFSWRIIASGPGSITLSIDELVVPKRGEICDSKLVLYDGYDEESTILESLCGIIKNEVKIIKTTGSISYIKFIISEMGISPTFHLKWTQSSSEVIEDMNKNTCGFNKTHIVTTGQSTSFHSPNYPKEYGNDLFCEWIFEASEGHHLLLRFNNFELEETNACYADRVSIYSRNIKEEWSPIKKNVCLWSDVKNSFEVSQLVKIIFETDSSTGRKGFVATVTSRCGGSLDNEAGVIEMTSDDLNNMYDQNIRCNWTIRVRPGRTINIDFEHFNITNDKQCNQYLMIRNGESFQSPLLGLGKYCGFAHERRESLLSSSNAVYVSYVNEKDVPISGRKPFQNFRLRYEEKNIECGQRSHLANDHEWEVISSPNYPSVPMPYSECIWIFFGPPGEILRLDFIERFDVDKSAECKEESVEIHDGASDLAPTIGEYCKNKPGSIKSTGNALFIKYTTKLAEPRNGFKANVSIDACGGTIVAESGEITSPGYPHMLILPSGSVCHWRIFSPSKHVIKITMVDLNLPDSDVLCGTNITITENIPGNKTTETFCSHNYDDFTVYESSTNDVLISLFIGLPDRYTQISESTGFKLRFTSSILTCGGRITESEGYLTTPGYPRNTVVRYCHWSIQVPDKTRRVKLEILDYNEFERIGVYNDDSFESLIKYDVLNKTQESLIYESSGNVLAFYLMIKGSSRPNDIRRFKAKFSSNEPVMCGRTLEGATGEILAPSLQRSYICSWTYDKSGNDNYDNSSNYNTIYVTVTDTSGRDNKCHYSHSRLILSAEIDNTGKELTRLICGNNTELAYRIPLTSVRVKAIQITHQPLMFHIKWKLQPCGGIVQVTQESKNILNIPSSFNESLECGWVVSAPDEVRIETKIEGMFTHDCSNEYITITQDLKESTSTLKYCKDNMLEKSLITSFKYMYVQYHSNVRRSSNLKLFTKISSNQCGGYLRELDNIFSSPNYPDMYKENTECTWIIQASIGYRVSLAFIQRFVVEDTINCTKDVVIIYDWKAESYREIARLCGRHLPPIYESSSDRMKVVFRTDSNVNLDGFIARWSQICGGKYIATEKEQYLFSPGYGLSYDPSLNCSYEITALNRNVQVEFKDFTLEGGYPECKFDNVTILTQRDYISEVSIYCGKHIPPLQENYKQVVIHFKTDRIGQYKGFKLSYAVYTCGGNVTEPTSIDSGSSDEYYTKMNCTWTIEAPVNKVVVVKFLYIDLEGHMSCSNDYIAVFDGPIIEDDKKLALLCGRINSTTVIKSNNNKAVVQFVSDDFLNYRGFRAEIVFSYGESVGCGGTINLLSVSEYTLKSPLIGKSFVYESFLDCHWFIKAPENKVIKVSFTTIHISPCTNVNQTAIGINKCDCDFVEIKDGLNPDSLVIGKYCGHTLPSHIISSSNVISIRLSTDGEIESSGFEIKLSISTATCSRAEIVVESDIKTIRSPGFENGVIPRGLHCTYILKESESYSVTHLRIQYLDLQPAIDNSCVNDKLIIRNTPETHNLTLGRNYILNRYSDNFFSHSNIYDPNLSFPEQFILCGSNSAVDFYLNGGITINLITSAESLTTHKGLEIQISKMGRCARNYTERYGRLQNGYDMNSHVGYLNCYTLITAPENYTISIYFNSVYPDFYNTNIYLEILDGDKQTSPVLLKVDNEYNSQSVFSTGRHILLHTQELDSDRVMYDLNYIATDKGRGCGGKLVNELGRITSPMYPDVYRKRSTCEWELETPIGTRIMLHFNEFDLGRMCDQNYLSLVDRSGNLISTYCSETPADFTSQDNYVKVVFTTTMNNGGTGWVLDFIGILL